MRYALIPEGQMTTVLSGSLHLYRKDWEFCACALKLRGLLQSNAPYFIMSPTKLEVAVGGMRLNIPTSIPLHFVAVWQMAAERQSDKMVSDMEPRMKQRYATDFPPVEKWHPLTYINTCRMLMETKLCMWTQWDGGQCISAVATAIWKTSHVLDGHAQLSHYKMKSIMIRSCTNQLMVVTMLKNSVL